MRQDLATRYWRRNLAYVAGVLAIWFAVSCLAAVVFADDLDRFHLGGFPLGFWFAQQGAILVFVALIAVYVRLVNALDRRHGVSEDEG